MIRCKLQTCVLAAALMAVLPVSAWSQNAEGGKKSPPADRGGDNSRKDGERRDRGGDRGRSERGRGDFNPEEMRRRMEEGQARMLSAMKERMGFANDEWKEVEPRLKKVVNLQSRGRGGVGMMFMGRGPGGPPEGGPRPEGGPPPGAGDTSEVGAKARELREALERDASTEQLNKAMNALREARKKQDNELAQARKDLRELLTLKQEAMLVGIGLLD